MTGSCNQEVLGKKTAEENYYTKRYKFALDGITTVPSKFKPPVHWKDKNGQWIDLNGQIHNAPLSTATEKSKLLSTMQDREAEVANVLMISFHINSLKMQIRNRAKTTAQALKTAENEREKALSIQQHVANEIVKLELLKSTHIIVNNMMHIQIF